MEKPAKCLCGSTQFWQPVGHDWVCVACHPDPNALDKLRDRVKLGNEKLWQALQQIKEMAHDSAEWSRQMDRWNQAQERLHLLCQELRARGFNNCLYMEGKERTKTCLTQGGGTWCQVCSSNIPYWEGEFANLGEVRRAKAIQLGGGTSFEVAVG